MLDRAVTPSVAGAAAAADAAAQRDQQRRVHRHQVGPADDRLGHVLGQRDAAGDDQRHFVAQARRDQPAVQLAQGVLDVPAGPAVFQALAPVQVGAQLEDPDALPAQLDDAVGRLLGRSAMRTATINRGWAACSLRATVARAR